jgi:glycosyltransferase involved in cell wall biosynthesis
MIQIEKTPKVSVCVITYNQEKYIRQCLQSIVDQETDFEFEVLVGDDCSTDGTRGIVREFAERYPEIVKPIYQEKNIGGGFHNYLTVHRAARGEYIAHIDGDDLMLPNKIQKQADYLDQNPGCTVVWHRVNFFDDSGNFFPGEDYDYSMFPNGVVTFSAALSLGSVAIHSSTMYRKTARKTVNPEFPTLDLFFSWEFLSSGWGMILDDVLGAYRVNSVGSISTTLRLLTRSLYANHAEYFFKRYPCYRKDVFFFALTNLLIDLKNRRRTSLDFLILAIRSFSLVGPMELFSHLKVARKLRIPELRTNTKTSNNGAGAQ